MADCRRPEVARDLIFGQKVSAVMVNIVTKFGGSSLNRLGAIQIAHFVTYDGDGGVHGLSHYRPSQLRWGFAR